jgi:hypothetical protein
MLAVFITAWVFTGGDCFGRLVRHTLVGLFVLPGICMGWHMHGLTMGASALLGLITPVLYYILAVQPASIQYGWLVVGPRILR